MGRICHNSIIVTGHIAREDEFRGLRDYAVGLFGFEFVTPMIVTDLNGYMFFFVAPDGSKEGWSQSDDGDAKRIEFCDHIDSLADEEDGSNFFNYIEVSHGERIHGKDSAIIERTNY